MTFSADRFADRDEENLSRNVGKGRARMRRDPGETWACS